MTESITGSVSRSTTLGITLALVVPVLYALWIGPFVVQPATTPATYALTGFVVYWLLAFALTAITKFGERKSLASLGLKRLSWRMGVVAGALGLLLSVTVPLLTLLAAQVLPVAESGGVVDTASRYPAWVMLLSILTAGITEEVVFRGYVLERLLQRTENLWISAVISLAAFVMAHGSGWNLGHILGVVLPLGALLTGLYLWQRNLIFVIIVHVLVDLPLFFIALGP